MSFTQVENAQGAGGKLASAAGARLWFNRLMS
jgi:hypothetical protein